MCNVCAIISVIYHWIYDYDQHEDLSEFIMCSYDQNTSQVDMCDVNINCQDRHTNAGVSTLIRQ